MDLKDTNGREVTYERLTLSNRTYLPLRDDKFVVTFSKALIEIASTKMSSVARRLMILFIGQLPLDEFKRGANALNLLTGEDYAEMINTHRPNIVKAFKELEELGYIKRNRGMRMIEITINPAVAYAGKWKEYRQTFNQLALDFGNEPLKEPINIDDKQDFSSKLPEQLSDKK